MSPYFWLVLKIFPLLLIFAAGFYWLGLRRGRRAITRYVADKDHTIAHEQKRTDETLAKLTDAEDALTLLRREFQELQSAHQQAAEQLDHLQRSAIPRRLLSDAEARIHQQDKEIAKMRALLVAQPIDFSTSEQPPEETSAEAAASLESDAESSAVPDRNSKSKRRRR
jgi:hypothetical protein